MSFKAIANADLGISASSARVAIPYLRVRDKGGQNNVTIIGNKLRLQADGADLRFKVGDASVVATTTDTLLQDNAIEEFTVNPGRDTHVAGIGSSGNLRITLGTGD